MPVPAIRMYFRSTRTILATKPPVARVSPVPFRSPIAEDMTAPPQTHADAAAAFRLAGGAPKPVPGAPGFDLSAPAPNAGPSALRQGLELLVVTLGIYACYLNYGLLQEVIYAGPYADGERFTYSAFLVLVQVSMNATAAALVLAVQAFLARGKKRTFAEAARKAKPVPFLEYMVVALCYLSAMLFSFTALNHMSYPMQALGKSCKMVPVMVMGVFIRRKRYSLREVLCVFLVTAGVAAFSFKPKKAGGGDGPTTPLGAALLLASLTMDGVTGPLQERLVACHAPTTHQLMFWQNAASVVWLAVGLAVTGEGAAAVAFCSRHYATSPLVGNMLKFAVVSAAGQNFIFYCVRHFSALVTTTITTTRKMFTVLLSIVVFEHTMAPRQWAGMGLVWLAITWEAVSKMQTMKAKEARGAEKEAADGAVEGDEGKKEL